MSERGWMLELAENRCGDGHKFCVRVRLQEERKEDRPGRCVLWLDQADQFGLDLQWWINRPRLSIIYTCGIVFGGRWAEQIRLAGYSLELLHERAMRFAGDAEVEVRTVRARRGIENRLRKDPALVRAFATLLGIPFER